MTLLGIELSDAGILAAAGNPPRLLPIDGEAQESPGFALSTNGRLIVGTEALKKARFNPRSYTNRFWDELSAESIKQPVLEGKTAAELAYLHLAKLWDMLRGTADEVVIAVPGFYTEHQLGILLGIAHELSIPVRGFAPIALAGSTGSYPKHLLFHLDIHLHRIEIILLEQGERLLQKEVKTVYGKGLSYLYAEWAKAIADEFVRTTRFDPFDQAVYEQELYNRLPLVLKNLQPHASATFTIQGKTHSYHVPLTYDLFAQKSNAVFVEVRRIIEDMVSGSGSRDRASVLQITHRMSPLPGCAEVLGTIPALKIIELAPGSGALGILKLRDRFASQSVSPSVIFITSIPGQVARETGDTRPALPDNASALPTHVLFKNRAYPITSQPLVIGGKGTDEVTVRSAGHAAHPAQTYCTIEARGNEVILVNYAEAGTCIDGQKVFTTSTLRLGQHIETGTPSDEIKLIACVDADEKEKPNHI